MNEHRTRFLPRPAHGGERAALLARAIVYATAMGMLVAPYSVAAGVIAGVAGTTLGVLVAERMRDLPLRLSAVALAALAAALLGVGLRALLVGTTPLPWLLGPELGFRVGEVVLWGALGAASAFWLRTLGARRPNLTVIEIAGVAAALVAGFAAHREGMVSRPLWIGDWAWSRDIDPAVVLLLIGGVAALLLAVLLVREHQGRRLALHFGALLAIGGVMVLFIQSTGLPQPKDDALGLTGKSEEEERRAREERARRARRGQGDPTDSEQRVRPEDFDFQDEYESSEGDSPPVAVVQLRDEYSPPTEVYYFRQSALSQYNGRRLVSTTRDDVDRDIPWGFAADAFAVDEVPPQSIDRRELEFAVALLAEHPRPFALDSPVRIAPLPNPDPLRFQRFFEVTARVQTTPYELLLDREAGDAVWSRDVWAHYTTMPNDPRYETLARELLGALPSEYAESPLAKALVIKQYLDTKGIYSRRNRHTSTSDPTASFLFGDKTGYCVHFAHAATYLLRSVGVPARVAVGYASPEEHRGLGADILLRGANAHAWPEIYLRGLGWTVVDLSPEQTLDEPLSRPDRRLQSMLGEMMRQRTKAEEAYFAEQRGWLTLAHLRALLLGAALATCVAAGAVKLYRRLAPHVAAPPHLYRLAYRAAMDRLADVGLHRTPGETRERFAARAAALAPAFSEVTSLHLAWALGSRRLPDPHALRELCDELRRELEQKVPAWRRLLGGVNPFSWVRVR
jgi:transglutaminase-like putative cysteine protease